MPMNLDYKTFWVQMLRFSSPTIPHISVFFSILTTLSLCSNRKDHGDVGYGCAQPSNPRPTKDRDPSSVLQCKHRLERRGEEIGSSLDACSPALSHDLVRNVAIGSVTVFGSSACLNCPPCPFGSPCNKSALLRTLRIRQFIKLVIYDYE